MADYPKRGEIWWIAFDPAAGGEIQKTRPAIVVSNNSSNKHLNRVQVIPLTSNIQKLYPAECYIMVGGKQSKAMASQVTTAAKQRLKTKLGVVSPAEMAEIEQALRLQLGL